MYSSTMVRATGVTFLILCLLAVPTIADEQALRLQHRTVAPVQGGPSAGVTVPAYEPGKIHVQLSASAVTKLTYGKDGDILAEALPGFNALNQTYRAGRIEHSFEAQLGNRPQLEAQLGLDRWYLIELDPSADIPAAVQAYRQDRDVDEATPVVPLILDVVPNDTLYSNSWGHDNQGQLPDYCWGCGGHPNGTPVGTVGFDGNTDIAWNGSEGFGNPGVLLAVLDSGVDVDHPDLNVVGGFDYIDNDSNPDDPSGHGTSVAGVAAGLTNNGIGVAGVAGGCGILAYRTNNNVHVSSALMQMVTDGADVANMSFSFPGAVVGTLPDVDAALEFAYNGGVTMVSSSGNENDNQFSIPAVHPRVMSIGAASPCGERKRSSSQPNELNPGVNADPNGYTCDGERWWGSNYGSNVQDAAGAVDLIAPTILPATDILGSGGFDPGDYFLWFNGTSCSSPYAAGVACLVKSYNPTWTPDQVRAQLRSTSADVISVESGAGWDRYTGYGMIDAAAAIGTTPPPVAEFSGTPTSGVEPLLVNFTDLSTGSPISWSWTFGDGGISTLQNPSHSYASAGTYTVSLMVSNTNGSDTETKTNYISVTQGGVIKSLALSDIPVSGTVSGNYTNTQTSDDVYESVLERESGGRKSNRYSFLEHKWTFNVTSGTSVTFFVEGYRPNNSEGDDFTFSWSTNNVTFTPLLTVNSATEQTYSAALPPSTSGTVYIQVVDTDQTPGNRTLDTVFIDRLCIETITTPPTNAPVADFTGSPTSGNAPLNVSFTDQSTENPTSWSWNFGDGNTSTAQNPSHTYSNPGTYDVSLMATNAIGSDTELKLGYITVSPSTQTVMHVQNIVVTPSQQGPWWRATAVVTIHDQSGQPVSGASVAGFFDAPNSNTKSGTTGTNGQVSLTSDKTRTRPSLWCFEVTSVSLSGAIYDQGSNLWTIRCDDGSGSSSATPEFLSSTPDVHQFGLVGNHPNPFNPRTEITFRLPAPAGVTLEIFNVTGKRVAILVDEPRGAGEHRIVWDARGMASGIYLARLRAGDEIDTRKMMLVK